MVNAVESHIRILTEYEYPKKVKCTSHQYQIGIFASCH